jgi:cell division protease FtsH
MYKVKRIMAFPEQDITLMFRNQIIARITGLIGGCVAEELFCHDITSGVSNDLHVATQRAEDMVMHLGMRVSGLPVFHRPEGFAVPHTGYFIHPPFGSLENEY